MEPRPPRSAYLHIPFCHRRCFYCDFPVVPLGDRAGGAAGQSGSRSIEAYLELITAEIEASPPGPPLSTVYVGGGDRKSTRLNSSHSQQSRMPSSA